MYVSYSSYPLAGTIGSMEVGDVRFSIGGYRALEPLGRTVLAVGDPFPTGEVCPPNG